MGLLRRSSCVVVLVAACAALAGTGCLEPLQSGGVRIVGDPSERIAAMCRFRHSGSTSELCLLEAAEEPGPGAENTQPRAEGSD